jgi:hypothetical protein
VIRIETESNVSATTTATTDLAGRHAIDVAAGQRPVIVADEADTLAAAPARLTHLPRLRVAATILVVAVVTIRDVAVADDRIRVVVPAHANTAGDAPTEEATEEAGAPTWTVLIKATIYFFIIFLLCSFFNKSFSLSQTC